MSSPETPGPATRPAPGRGPLEPVTMAAFAAGVSEPAVIACLRTSPMAGEAYPSWPLTCAASVPAARGGPARVPPPSTTSVWPVM